MTKINDYLEPLNQGIWEVVIPKEDVTEPLGDEWEKSPINVPSPGTIASYRNGQYHIHESKNEWHVHLDRYDPKAHPFLHLIDDAPLFLMISETIITLFSEVRGKTTNIQMKMEQQDRFIKNGILSGIFMILLGITFIIEPEMIYNSIFGLIIPLMVIFIGIIAIIQNLYRKSIKEVNKKDLLNSALIVFVGIILGIIPILLWSLILISILGLWMLLSALLLLNRVRKGKDAVPEGFYSRFVIAIISLSLGIIMFYAPALILELLLIIAGIIIILAGCLIITTTLHMKRRSSLHPTKEMAL